MDIRKLDVFCKVVELKSFTKAAQAIQLSQPTVSDHIRTLEEELGHKLVDRLGREVEPTPTGCLLYSYATRILRLQQETLQAISQHGGQFSGDLLIGASTISGTFILPGLLGSFRRQYPKIKTIVHIGGSQIIAKKVLDGEFDLGLVGALWNERGLEWQPLFHDNLVLVAPPDSPLIKIQPIGIDTLLKQPFVLREQESGTRKVLAHILETKGYKETDLQDVAQFGSNEAVKEAVKAGMGVSMLSRRSIAEELQRGTLVALALEGVAGERPFYLVTRKNRALQPSASALAHHLQAAAE
jgi:DNA-binding transcriptional LysR family regulator